MKKPLIVYKASAGSGKTFTLAVEYISLLVRDPECHRHILAVTFTNKATEEMKMRIISQLYGIAHRDPDSGNYLRAVMSKTGLDEQTIVSYYGLFDEPRLSLDEIAEKRKETPELTLETIDKCIRKLAVTPEWQMMNKTL